MDLLPNTLISRRKNLTKTKKYGTINPIKYIILRRRDIMGIFRRYTSVIFVCAIFCTNISYAQIPISNIQGIVSDANNTEQVFKQLEKARNSMTQLAGNVKAMGGSVTSTLGGFMGEILAIAGSYSGLLSSGADFINQTTGSNIKVGEKLDNDIMSIKNKHNNAMNEVWTELNEGLSYVDYVDYGASGIEALEGVVGLAGGIAGDIATGYSEDSNLWDKVKETSSNINGYVQDANTALDGLAGVGVPPDVIDGIRKPINDANNTQNGAVYTGNNIGYGYKAGLGSDGDSKGIWDNLSGAANGVVAAAEGAISTAGSAGIYDQDLTDALNGMSASGDLLGVLADMGQDGNNVYDAYKNKKSSEDVEEEEEEEEISEEASLGQDLKEALQSAHQKSEKIYIQFNDMLDMNINTLNTNAAENDKVFEQLINGIYSAKKIPENAKEEFRIRLDGLKKTYRKIADRNIILVETIKSNYAKEYKEKVEDNIKNYDRLIDMYIRGDASKEDVLKAGEKIKKEVEAFNLQIDKEAKKEIENDMKNAKKELEDLVKDIKNVESGENDTSN